MTTHFWNVPQAQWAKQQLSISAKAPTMSWFWVVIFSWILVALTGQVERWRWKGNQTCPTLGNWSCQETGFKNSLALVEPSQSLERRISSMNKVEECCLSQCSHLILSLICIGNMHYSQWIALAQFFRGIAPKRSRMDSWRVWSQCPVWHMTRANSVKLKQRFPHATTKGYSSLFDSIKRSM